MATATTTPKELAEKVGRDPKIVRSYLRANFPREAEAKNSRWGIPATVAKAVTAHFAALDKGKTDEEAKAS